VGKQGQWCSDAGTDAEATQQPGRETAMMLCICSSMWSNKGRSNAAPSKKQRSTKEEAQNPRSQRDTTSEAHQPTSLRDRGEGDPREASTKQTTTQNAALQQKLGEEWIAMERVAEAMICAAEAASSRTSRAMMRRKQLARRERKSSSHAHSTGLWTLTERT